MLVVLMIGLVDLVTISLVIKGNCSFQRQVFITAFKKMSIDITIILL